MAVRRALSFFLRQLVELGSLTMTNSVEAYATIFSRTPNLVVGIRSWHS